MTNTLIITTHYPLPEVTGASMRTMHYVRYFKTLGPVDIACAFGHPGDGADHEIFRRVFQLDIQHKSGMAKRLAVGALTREPYPIYRFEQSTRKLVRELVTTGGYDHIVIRSAYPSALLFDLPAAKRRRVLLDFDDNIGGTLYDQLINAPTLSSAKHRVLEWNRCLIERHERRCASEGTLVVCSQLDQARMTQTGNDLPAIVPNIYSPPAFAAETAADGYAKSSLLFVGALEYEPNADGLAWFVTKIFPEFRRRHPDTHLVVVGRNPTESTRLLCERTEAVELHANVPDTLPFYRNCRAVVVPLLAGGGTRIKILESAYAQRPVISTRIGAEGLDLADRTELLLFENAADFVSAYEMLDNRDFYDQMVRRAKETVTTKYSAAAVERAIASVSANRRGAA